LRGGAWAGRDAGGGGGGGGGEAETVLRTDHAGRVVEVRLPTPRRATACAPVENLRALRPDARCCFAPT
jgi:hypothetical protein